MALLGPRDKSSLVMLTGWDATVLQNFALQDGITFDDVVSDMSGALAALNAELLGDPLWSSMVSYTDQPEVKYNVGASSNMNKFTEYGQADPKRSEREGHTLPKLPWDTALGWTWAYLKEARMSDIEGDIREHINAVRNRYRLQILTRALQRGDDSGVNKGLGSSGYSTGFATAAASTSVDFVPPSHGGSTFTSAHEHYIGIAGGVFTNPVFTDAKDELREHGHEPPYEFVAGPSDEAAIRALTDFTPVGSDLVAYGSLQDLAKLDAMRNGASYYIGTINDFGVRIVPGIPQYYGFGWKSYGPNSTRNPFQIRLEKGATIPQVIAMVDPRSGGNAAYPLQSIMLYLEFGVGVSDRTNGTARYVNNATWADGTPT